jgi:hypothetical protein
LQALALKEGIVCDQKRLHFLLGEIGKARFDVAFGAGIEYMHPQPEFALSDFNVLDARGALG